MVAKGAENLPLETDQEKDSGIKWTSVSLSEVAVGDERMGASLFGVEGRKAREVIEECGLPVHTITGPSGLAKAFHRPRFKRHFVEHSEYPFFQSAQINEMYPKPHLWLSETTPTDIEALRVKKGQILMTCSGTIGNCTVVGDTSNGQVFSHDLIRINPNEPEFAGYIYAFLRTQVGQDLVSTNNYGAVVSHFEPEHFDEIPIPLPSEELIKRVNELVMDSVGKLDQSNRLIDEAERELLEALDLQDFRKIKGKNFSEENNFQNTEVRASELNGRLEAHFHRPKSKAIKEHLQNNAPEVATISDQRLSNCIILPGRFKRVYVEKGQGVPFIGGKQIHQLDPVNKKYLSLSHHGERVREQLFLKKNMVAVTCSGTIGKVNIIPEHWENWTVNQHVMRITPASDRIAGYLFCWLNTDYGKELITRRKFGQNVDTIVQDNLGSVEVPLAELEVQERINTKILEANNLRAMAYHSDQKAIGLVESEVLKLSSPMNSVSN